MGDTINFDYYYGIEAEQFSFYRVPRLLIKDERFKGLSSDAKLLYGLMLDRMSLSMKNGWLDDENRAYIIYTVDAIMEDLGCSKPTCTKIMRELDSDNGIGLIEKKRRGLGKPDIIYVKNFASVPDECVWYMMSGSALLYWSITWMGILRIIPTTTMQRTCIITCWVNGNSAGLWIRQRLTGQKNLKIMNRH